MVVLGPVIASPNRRVSLQTCIACAAEYKWPFITRLLCSFIARTCHLQTVYIMCLEMACFVSIIIEQYITWHFLAPGGNLIHVIPDAAYPVVRKKPGFFTPP